MESIAWRNSGETKPCNGTKNESDMIPDWLTTRVYVSNLLAKQHPEVHASLAAILKNTGIILRTIPGTKDIWCRDYCPIQVAEDSYVQFIYRPDYLKGHESLITPAARCRLKIMTGYRKVPLIIDGGNVVASEKRVILTDKIYRENRDRSRSEIRAMLEKAFGAECIIIRKEPFDRVGHADGVVRFITADVVVINDYSRLEPQYGQKLRAGLKRKGLSVEVFPYVPCRTRLSNQLDSAVGNYVNFLRVGNVIVLPAYGVRQDDMALKKAQALLPGTRIFQQPCRTLAEEGGVLNCVTWTMKRSRR